MVKVKTITIEAEGPGEVKAGDIKTDGDIEVVNKDLHIASLDEDGKLYMEIMVNNGEGMFLKQEIKVRIILYPQFLLIPYILG